MDLKDSPSVGKQLQALQVELAELQAAQTAELGKLEQALELARAERAAEAAAVRQQAAGAAQLQDITAQVAELQEEVDRLRAEKKVLGEEHRALQDCHRYTCCHRCLKGLGDIDGPLPVSPHPEDPEDTQPQCPEGTQSQETINKFKSFILFIVASTIIFLYPWMRQ